MNNRKHLNFLNSFDGSVGIMEHNGFKARIMCAERLVDNGRPHGLPPGDELPVWPISSLPGCPDSWVREPGTYVVVAGCNIGLWFDWTMNDVMNTAVLPSVKGMNPITGRKLEGPGLESYQENCPIHGTPFGHNLLCEECGYRWPAQNYVTYESTLWWDGFRQPDGKVRQFFFTEDEKRDIASLVIGKENTMPAFGFVFYKTKEHRERVITSSLPFAGIVSTPNWVYDTGPYYTYSTPIIGDLEMGDGSSTAGGSARHVYCSTNTTTGDIGDVGPSGPQGSLTSSNGRDMVFNKAITRSVSGMNLTGKDHPLRKQTKKKSLHGKSAEVSIGAGAEIKQELSPDGLGMDGWTDEPSSIIRLYFCFEDQFRQIVDRGGVRGIQTKREGFMQNLPVG